MKITKLLLMTYIFLSLFSLENVSAAASVNPSTYEINYTGNTTINAKDEYKTSINFKTKKANEFGYEKVKFKAVILEGDETKVNIYANLKENEEVNLLKVNSLGEFSLPANYNNTTNIRIVFEEEGNYKISFQLLSNDNVIASEEVSMSVMESLTTFKEQNKNNNLNKIIPISIISGVLVLGLYVYFKDRIII